ncbi:hypothetical protein [Neopusillimonas maritima]|uniref:Uncharacterized protein n=1 Tax=Neopusillimonas maritima TaxID=2026239 RepID=A0A3A1YWQ7_9BURK|nr:hypothetical protein [Neopusillimonas maritima]RIY41985.1 hypothetical protein CJP73_00625 [Neopusillimonas maritima]
MTVTEYALMLVATVAVAAVCEGVWMNWIRPRLAHQFGWKEVRPNERIPAAAWAGSAAVLLILFVFLPFVGVAAGY